MSNNTFAPADDIRLIDTLHLGRSQVIGTYLLLGDEPMLVDPGPTSTLTNVEAGLQTHGLTLGDIRTLLLTHIHLDHAGSTGTILARYPHIRAYVHERGAPHMLNPEKLLTSATRLYGELMDVLWGEFRAVPAERLTVLSGGETLRLGGRTLDVRYAPGHASHHVIYFDQGSGAAFVGDNAGIRLPDSSYVRPATPPPDVNLEAWDSTLTMLREFEPKVLCLTHFGPSFDSLAHIDSYRQRLHHWAEVVRAGLASGDDEASQIERLQKVAASELDDFPDEVARYDQAAPLFQSWQGLARYWRKRE